jgi:hypothetical protein
MIAVWGNVVLTPVDADNIKKLAEGRSPKLGFMVDFVADFERSAKKGLPIYKIGGGAGLVLAVSYGNPDRGTLRLIAVDASKFTSPATDQAQATVAAQPSPATDQAPAVGQPSPTTRQLAIVAQPLNHHWLPVKRPMLRNDHQPLIKQLMLLNSRHSQSIKRLMH